MEGTVSSLIYAVLAGKWDLDKTVFNEDNEDLLGDLQEVHDIKANEGRWPELLKEVADKYKLEFKF